MIADRAYLSGARIGGGLARLEAEVARTWGCWARPAPCGSSPRRCSRLTCSLDLYGEDVRARAFATRDDGAEMIPAAGLHRPDRAAAHGCQRRHRPLRLDG